MTVHETHRWRGISAVALLAGAVGVVTSSPVVLLTGVIGVAFAAYATTASEPTVSLAFARTVDDPEPVSGEDVRVTVTVENTGRNLLPDLRIVDGVPGPLAVADGFPRLGTSLQPGAQASFSYTVEAVHGEHDFGPAQVLARDFSGALEVETTADDETTITCAPPLHATESVALRPQTTQYTGRVLTREGGTGVEFFSVREYRPGDSLSRIDWNQRARTGDLTTVEFREERAATVVLVVDTREEAYVAPADGEENAVQHGVDAAGQVFATLLDSGDQVGLAAFGPSSCWLAPGAGNDHRNRARDLLATDPAFSLVPSSEPFYPATRMRWLRRRLPGAAQVVFFSPLCDDYAVDVVRRLDAYGHAVTVVSPDPTASATAGQRLARVERANRLSALRTHGLRVVDWDTDRRLGVALDRASERWSA